MSCILISGNPKDGFKHVGPFTHEALATSWAEEWDDEGDWWVVPLVSPKHIEDQFHASQQHSSQRN